MSLSISGACEERKEDRAWFDPNYASIGVWVALSVQILSWRIQLCVSYRLKNAICARPW
jgi:hypothetical protein